MTYLTHNYKINFLDQLTLKKLERMTIMLVIFHTFLLDEIRKI